MILATRYGFHGKKGLAGAVTGSEHDPERDPRVRFISFPREECYSRRAPPAAARSRAVRRRARSDSTRARRPDLLPDHRAVPRRRRLVPSAEGVPATAASASAASTTSSSSSTRCRRTSAAPARCSPSPTTASSPTSSCWARAWATACRSTPSSAGPTCSPTRTTAKAPTPGAATRWAAPPCWPRSTNSRQTDVLGHAPRAVGKSSKRACCGSPSCRPSPPSAAKGTCGASSAPRVGDRTSNEVAREIVRACYHGDAAGRAIHLLGPLAGDVIRVAPPLVMPLDEAQEYLDAMYAIIDACSPPSSPATDLRRRPQARPGPATSHPQRPPIVAILPVHQRRRPVVVELQLRSNPTPSFCSGKPRRPSPPAPLRSAAR